MNKWRKTTQFLAPARAITTSPGAYNIYPGFPIEKGKINAGFPALAQLFSGKQTIFLDGYGGVLWEHFRLGLDTELKKLGILANWIDVNSALKSEDEINAGITPYLGGDDPLFGKRYTGILSDFFNPQDLKNLKPDTTADLNILYGCGAALVVASDNIYGLPMNNTTRNAGTLLVYIDVPKNEIQFRSRAGSIKNLGATVSASPKEMYKRFYFVDWVVLNKHKADLLPQLDLIIDEQRPDEPVFIQGDDLRSGLNKMAHNFFRVRPWFEPGPWGGQWIKEHIQHLAQDVPNYAWSFELITPENGIVFRSGELLLEISFDMLMFQEYPCILGDCAENFRYEFPIRYDFLDTVEGGNLSIQCHPRPEFIRKQFGETFTQDECYYILDCVQGAEVYLGFQDGIDKDELRHKLEESAINGTPVDIQHFVTTTPVKKHDLLLIPNGTIHGSGKGNLVLEISATPYIFTFKMYDWLRLDLDGKPRPLNITRAFENLYFERRGKAVQNELISKPVLLEEGNDWRVIHCPTHVQHFYDVHRLEFTKTIDIKLYGSCHVLSLVEGKTVLLETSNGLQQHFNYAETFVIPAAAGSYRLISEAGELIKVVKTYIKPSSDWAIGAVPNM